MAGTGETGFFLAAAACLPLGDMDLRVLSFSSLVNESGFRPTRPASASFSTTTRTLYSPGKAPSSDRKVVSRKLPSVSVRPLAGRPSPTGVKVTVAPPRGLPSRVTTPATLTGLPPPPQPTASGTRARSSRPGKGQRLRDVILLASSRLVSHGGRGV